MKIVVWILLFSISVLCSSISLHAQNTNISKVSADAHFLRHKDGKPFFYMGDTGWELFHRLNREEANRYLQDRAKNLLRKNYTAHK
ncbi:MAG: DUF4038 domain-containing protein [Ginsengibacter sp.]